MKDPMLGEIAHHAIAETSEAEVKSIIGLRPNVSDNGANMGIKAVEVIRKAVDSHEAESEE